MPWFVGLGLLGRPFALFLFICNIIAFPSFPGLWPHGFWHGLLGTSAFADHGIWGLMPLAVIAWGPGKWSLDTLVRWVLHRARAPSLRVVVGLVLLAVVAVLRLVALQHDLSVTTLKVAQHDLLADVAAHSLASAAAFFGVYVLATAISLPLEFLEPRRQRDRIAEPVQVATDQDSTHVSVPRNAATRTARPEYAAHQAWRNVPAGFLHVGVASVLRKSLSRHTIS